MIAERVHEFACGCVAEYWKHNGRIVIGDIDRLCKSAKMIPVERSDLIPQHLLRQLNKEGANDHV